MTSPTATILTEKNNNITQQYEKRSYIMELQQNRENPNGNWNTGWRNRSAGYGYR